MLFYDVQNKVEKLKAQLNTSSDVGTRIIEKAAACIGLVYLKSMVDNALFVDGICRPIIASEDVSLQNFSTIISTAEVTQIEDSQAVE